MGQRRVNYLSLIDHKLIQLTLSIPVGKPTYTVIDSGTEAHTGTSVDFVKIAWDGNEHVHYFQGPTLIGLGPHAARAERDRLRLLRRQVDEALASVERTVAFFDGTQEPSQQASKPQDKDPSPTGSRSDNHALVRDVLRGACTPSTHSWLWDDNTFAFAVQELWKTDQPWLRGLIDDPQWPFLRRLDLAVECPDTLRRDVLQQLALSCAAEVTPMEARASFVEWLEEGGHLPEPEGQAYARLREELCVLESLEPDWLTAILTERSLPHRGRRRAAALMLTDLKRTIKARLRAEASDNDS